MRHTSKLRRAAAAVAVLAAVSSCSHAPGVSNGSVSVCYRAIPIGRGAIHEKSAKLIGVHRVPVDTVRSRLPASAQSQLANENDTAVCAMAFRGNFGAGQVQLAAPDQTGDYAIVLVSSLRLHLVGSVVLDQLPPSFGGRRI
jgi:hypothetical protein